jgi:hypothetical protein
LRIRGKRLREIREHRDPNEMSHFVFSRRDGRLIRYNIFWQTTLRKRRLPHLLGPNGHRGMSGFRSFMIG